VVAWDRHGVGYIGVTLASAGGRAANLADLDTLGVMAFGVNDLVSQVVQALAERVVVA
jgi:hypothetical protein